MQPEQLLRSLHDFLRGQCELFTAMEPIQNRLDSALAEGGSLESILALLDQKGSLVDQVSTNAADSKGLVDRWLLERDALRSLEGYPAVMTQLDTMEGMVTALRQREEGLIERFGKYVNAPPTVEERQRRSQHILDAWRALR